MWSTVCDLIELSPSRKERRMTTLKKKMAVRIVALIFITVGLITNSRIDMLGVALSLAVSGYELWVEKEGKEE